MKVASDLSASNTLAGIHVDNGTFYVQSGKAPVAPIAVASGAIMELGAGLAASAVGGAVTIASGAEMLVDAGATVPHPVTTAVVYNFDITTGYYKTASGLRLAWPANFDRYGDTTHGQLPNWIPANGYTTYASYGSVTNIIYYNDRNGKHYFYPSGSFSAYTAPSTETDIFPVGINFAPGSKLTLGVGSTWARDITVGTFR
jgi:hypothetical protein